MTSGSKSKSILIVELWGMGDTLLMGSIIPELLKAGHAVTVLSKPGNCELLSRFYPDIDYIPFVLPWTAYRQVDKYKIWQWPWKGMSQLVKDLRKCDFDCAVSVRRDPRDHLLMSLAGVSNRFGYAHVFSLPLLNCRVKAADRIIHRVEEWQILARAIIRNDRSSCQSPQWPLIKNQNRDQSEQTPVWVIHCGAGEAVRRWPVRHFQTLIPKLRQHCNFHLEVIPDSDGFGRELEPLADKIHDKLSLLEFIEILKNASLFIGNDSGPGHLAAALGKPVISFFGPQYPAWFAPYGENHLVLGGKYSEPWPKHCKCPSNPPYDMDQLTTEIIWPYIQEFLGEYFPFSQNSPDDATKKI